MRCPELQTGDLAGAAGFTACLFPASRGMDPGVRRTTSIVARHQPVMATPSTDYFRTFTACLAIAA
jgi:hypothetical protein